MYRCSIEAACALDAQRERHRQARMHGEAHVPNNSSKKIGA